MALGTDMNTLNDDEFRSYSASATVTKESTMVTGAPSVGKASPMPERSADKGQSGGFSR